MKICNKCLIPKEEIQFSKHRNVCKVCMSMYHKEYKNKYSEKIELYQKKYNIENKRVLGEKKKEYYLSNKEKIDIRNKQWYCENKVEILPDRKIYADKWRKENKKLSKLINKKYRDSNRVKINKQIKDRILVDPVYKLSRSLRSSILSILKRNGFTKKSKTQEIIGCSIEDFKLYIESKFEPWMTWENKGLYNGELNYGWDIDHIIPLSSAKTEEELLNLNNYKNLQPLCSYINRYVKKDKIISINS